MARAFVRVNVSSALQKLEATEAEIKKAAQDLSMEVAEAGAEKMRELIQTGGTGRRWAMPYYAKEFPRSGSLRDGSYPGRVNTGKMLNSVRVKFEQGARQTLAAFGWIGNAEPYFKYQEYGFTEGGMRPDMPVKGMFALRDARLYAVRLTKSLVGKYAKRIAGGKY